VPCHSSGIRRPSAVKFLSSNHDVLLFELNGALFADRVPFVLPPLLDRFIVIVFPIRSRSLCTMSNCRRAVLAVWIVSLLLTAQVLFTKVIKFSQILFKF
jgi:hypothetical protein